MDLEIDRLNHSITNLSEAIRDLRTEINAIRQDMRTDFSRLIDRQDSQFRWLVGIMIASAIGLATLIFRSHA